MGNTSSKTKSAILIHHINDRMMCSDDLKLVRKLDILSREACVDDKALFEKYEKRTNLLLQIVDAHKKNNPARFIRT